MPNKSSKLDHEVQRKLYSCMRRIRLVEETIAQQYGQQKMRCPVHLSIGQEAIAAGVCLNLTADDYVFSNHRCHAHYLAQGGALKAMIAEMYGKAAGCAGGRGGSMHLIDLAVGFRGSAPIVGSTIPIAVGAAWAAQMQRQNKVTAVFFGDGATEEGVFHESLNIALLKNLPVIFVCENNHYSVNTPMSQRRSAKTKLYELAGGHGMEAEQGDGNDAGQVYEMAGWAIERARQGKGPTFLEFSTYRWLEHCGPGDDSGLGYRTLKEIVDWQSKCPIDKLKSCLLTEDPGFDQSWFTQLDDEIKKEIEEAFAFAESAASPSSADLLSSIYAQ